MKVLHVIAEMDPKLGGVCQAVRSIIAGLSTQNVDNEVVSLDRPDAPFLANDPFPTHALGPGRGPWSYNPALVSWLTANLGRFDCVIAHGLWLYPTYAVRRALTHFVRQRPAAADERPAPRLFVMPHGMLDPYFQRAAGRKLKAVRNWIYWKLIEGQVINSADGLLFTCEDERRLAREPFQPYHPKREIVVGLGVEEPPAYTQAMREAFLAQCPELRAQPYLLFLSRLHEKKGIDLLLKAYARAAEKAPLAVGVAASKGAAEEAASADLPRLVIAGPGLETPYGQQMQQLASQVSAPGAVTFPGMLTGNSKWGAFYGCEAFVLPSHQENFGIAVVEALACSKPVLISNQVNIWREIESAGACFVADDTRQGTQALLDQWQHLSEVEQRAMGQRARKSFENDFATGPAATRLLKALSD